MDRWIQTDAGGMQVEMKMNGQIHGLIHQKTLIGFREVMEVMKVEVEVEVGVHQTGMNLLGRLREVKAWEVLRGRWVQGLRDTRARHSPMHGTPGYHIRGQPTTPVKGPHGTEQADASWCWSDV